VTLLAAEVVVGVSSGLFEPAMRHTTLSYALVGGHGLAASFLQLTQRLAATFCVALVTGVAFASGDGVTVSTGGMLAAVAVCVILLSSALVLAATDARGAVRGD
jgi:hypothetical protein